MYVKFPKRVLALFALSLFGSAAVHAEEGITILDGKASFNALVQAWALNDSSITHQIPSATAIDPASGLPHQNGGTTTFRIRHAYFAFTLRPADNWRASISVDPSAILANSFINGGNPATGASSLQYNPLFDAYVAYTPIPDLEIWLGQFKVPGSAEGTDPTGELLFVERSMVARFYGGYWEPGAMLVYKKPRFRLTAALTNGDGDGWFSRDWTNGTSIDDHPNGKDLHFRADVKPIDMLSVGAFTQLTDFNYGRRGIWGANARVMPLEDLVLRIEGVRGYDKGGPTPSSQAADAAPRNGYAADVSYKYGDWQPVFRYEMMQASTGLASGAPNPATQVTGTAWTAGLNYYINKHNAKIMFNYTGLTNACGSCSIGALAFPNSATGLNSSPTPFPFGAYGPAKDFNGGLATLQFQASI